MDNLLHVDLMVVFSTCQADKHRDWQFDGLGFVVYLISDFLFIELTNFLT